MLAKALPLTGARLPDDTGSVDQWNGEGYWALEATEVLRLVDSSPAGLSSAEAAARLAAIGPNELQEQRSPSRLGVVWNQLRNPMLLILVIAALVSAATGGWTDTFIVCSIVLASTWLGYSREYRAQTAAAALRSRTRVLAEVLRDNRRTHVPLQELVPGDVVLLSAGSLVPGDGLVLESTDLFVNQAVLTGESFPVEKAPGVMPREARVAERTNSVFLGTNVRTGTALCLLVTTGKRTQFGRVAHRLTLRAPQTEFERGLRRFGYLLTIAMLVMVFTIFGANVLMRRPPIETLLFAVALAVGLSPELLPAILSVNLARSAQLMARLGVLVKRLDAIESLGSMDVLCTDKTGTLTEGVVSLEGAYDARGETSAEVLTLAAVNASLQTGLSNPLDEAILRVRPTDLGQRSKLAEVPYDFVRKRLSVIFREQDGVVLVTKGAFAHVLEVCTQDASGNPLDHRQREDLEHRFQAWSARGVRVLAVAARTLREGEPRTREAESNLRFLGFLTFIDRPKQGAARALADLATLGVSVKLITGDNRLVAESVAARVGLRQGHVLTGKDLDELHDEALWRAAEETDLFVEVDPNQKERIILSLKKMGHVVGFLGDGVNDAPAMHAADTALSVDQAADVAKEAADFVLLERNLDVIRQGIEAGRKTFANTLKYILTTTSANLGNMVSMAVASLFLPFLPLLAGQILLNNFLSDIPAVGLADDSVDRELIDRPRRWDLRFIGRFMVAFGVLSSLFDFVTFGVLFAFFAASPELFRTGWFVESLLTELVIALVVRTRRPFFRSRPGALLLGSTLVLIPLTFAVPFLPFAGLMGFVPMPPSLVVAIAAVTAFYVLATEFAKARFYRSAA